MTSHIRLAETFLLLAGVALMAACSTSSKGSSYTLVDVNGALERVGLVIIEQHEIDDGLPNAREAAALVVRCEAAVECESVEVDVYVFEGSAESGNARDGAAALSDCVWTNSNVMAFALDCESDTAARVQGAVEALGRATTTPS